MRRREFIAGLGSATLGWPLTAHAQQLPVIGFLSAGAEGGTGPNITAIRKGLGELGYVEGRNVTIDYRLTYGQNDRLPEAAADLVRRQVAVLVTSPSAAAVAAKAATATIPIVFSIGADRVELGLVKSLNRPGGNLTGVVLLTVELQAKRLELLHQLAPAAKSVAFLANPTSAAYKSDLIQLQAAARVLGLRLAVLDAVERSQIEAAITTLIQSGAGGLLVSSDPLFTDRHQQIVAMAASAGIPAIYAWREYVEAGGLMSYGTSRSDGYRIVGNYAGRILKGERPANLPVQRSSKTEFVVNLKAAKALGRDVPTAILLRADEVIE